MLTRYSRNVKIRRSRSGSEIVCWRVTNNATHAIPTSTGAHTSGSASPMLAPADFRSQIAENDIGHGIERRLRHAPEAGAYYHDGEQRVNVAFALIHLLTASHLPLPAPTPCRKDDPEAKSGRKPFCAQGEIVAERKREVSPSCAENRCRGEKICPYQKNEVSN